MQWRHTGCQYFNTRTYEVEFYWHNTISFWRYDVGLCAYNKCNPFVFVWKSFFYLLFSISFKLILFCFCFSFFYLRINYFLQNDFSCSCFMFLLSEFIWSVTVLSILVCKKTTKHEWSTCLPQTSIMVR